MNECFLSRTKTLVIKDSEDYPEDFFADIELSDEEREVIKEMRSKGKDENNN